MMRTILPPALPFLSSPPSLPPAEQRGIQHERIFSNHCSATPVGTLDFKCRISHCFPSMTFRQLPHPTEMLYVEANTAEYRSDFGYLSLDKLLFPSHQYTPPTHPSPVTLTDPREAASTDRSLSCTCALVMFLRAVTRGVTICCASVPLGVRSWLDHLSKQMNVRHAHTIQLHIALGMHLRLVP